MYRKNHRRKTGNVSGLLKTAAVLAAVIAALVLTGCGKEEKARFASPQEYYRHVETAALEDMGERFDERYDKAVQTAYAFDRRTDTEMTLELFQPAQNMLETYTGMDFSWLKTLGVAAGVDLAEDSAAVELALSLNGRELIGMEVLADIAGRTLYGRLPLLSKEYFRAGFDELGLYGVDQAVFGQREEMFDALPDGQMFSDLLLRCAEAALENVEDVEQGSDTLEAGGVSAKYTTLTVTLDEDELHDMVKDVCKLLKKDKDVEAFFAYMEEQIGTGIYDDFLDALDELPGYIKLDDDIVMTLYVDGDDVIRGREIEYDDLILRYVRPVDGRDFGFEVSCELDGDMLWRISGDGREDGDTLEATSTFEVDDTEWFTLSIEDLDMERLDEGELIGTFTLRPTYEFYSFCGFYSLTARALEDFFYALEAEENAAAFNVYMSGEPFLALTLRTESGPAEGLPNVSGASDLNDWSMSLVLSGGLQDYMSYLEGSDLPPELLRQLVGALF